MLSNIELFAPIIIAVVILVASPVVFNYVWGCIDTFKDYLVAQTKIKEDEARKDRYAAEIVARLLSELNAEVPPPLIPDPNAVIRSRELEIMMKVLRHIVSKNGHELIEHAGLLAALNDDSIQRYCPASVYPKKGGASVNETVTSIMHAVTTLKEAGKINKMDFMARPDYKFWPQHHNYYPHNEIKIIMFEAMRK